MSNFTCAVWAEVKENNSVISLYAVIIADYNRNDKFVSNFVVVRIFNRRCRISFFRRVRLSNGIISFLNAIPTFITIHSVVASGNCSRLSYANFFKLFFKRCKIFSGTARRNVAPVQKCMNVNFLNAFILSKFQKSVKVVCVTVNAAGTQQAEKMKCAATCYNFISYADKCGIREKFSVANCLCNFSKRLINNSACADIHMPDFRIAHLSVGKSYKFSGRLQFRVGIFFRKFIKNRRISNLNCVVLIGNVADTPAVHNNQTNRCVFNGSHL